MFSDIINNWLLVVTVIVGFFSMAVNWVFVIELLRNESVLPYKTAKRYSSVSYVFSVLMLAVMWITTIGKDEALISTLVSLLIGWIITFVLSFVLSCIPKFDVKTRGKIRHVSYPCIIRLVVLCLIVWLVY